MSVEIAGAAGYDYQDLICLYISILLSELEGIQCKIENFDGEDCEIRYIYENEEYVIDVQVKNRTNFIEIEEFSEWISHFEKYSSDMHLLKKLNEDRNRFLLFVTNNRVENNLINFVMDEKGLLHLTNSKGFNYTLIDQIKVDIKNVFKESTPLAIKRKEEIDNFCTDSTSNIFRYIFKKIKIWELKSEELVKEQLENLLNKKYLVPKSKVNKLIFEMLDTVKSYKGNNQSIIEEIISKIDLYSESLVLPVDTLFIENKDFSVLEDTLGESHFLLLSGVPLCGKSFYAKRLASKYQQKGYYCLITSEVDEAMNFVSKNDMEDKFLILEDPFGAITPEQRVSEIIRKLNIICTNSNVNKKIIITSRKDILLNVFNVNSLASCNIGEVSWFDLTNKDTNFLQEYWKMKITNENFSNVIDEIINYLKKHSIDNYLQIGELNHLLNTTPIDALPEMETSKVVDLARVNSHDIANFIINDLSDVYKKVFIALTLACNTTKPIEPRHLHYILSEISDYFSIRKELDVIGGGSFSLTENEENNNILWDYSKEFEKISNENFKQAIIYFRKCGYINITSDGIIFNHPIYQHVGYIIILKDLEIEYYADEAIYEMLKKGIATTSKFTGNSTIRVLEYLYLNLQNNNRVLELLYMAFKSIFPSVIDRSISFLLEHFSGFDKNNQKILIDTIMLNKDNKEIIKWHNDEPYIFENELTMSRYLENLLTQRSNNLDLLSKESLSSKEVWECLKIEYNEEIKSPYLEVLKGAVFLDEVFIKEKAYYNLFKFFVHEDINLSKLLIYNEHPNIIYKSYLGAFHNWGNYSAESKEYLITKLKEYLKEPPVSIRFLRFLENFQDEYITDGIPWSELNHSQKKELWEVWYELFNQVFYYFPFDFKRIHEAHLVAVTEDSLKYVHDANLIVNFSYNWHKWLKSLNSRSYPDDYGMSVAAYLMEGTKNDSEARKEVFKTLINDDETSLITTHLSHFIDYWELLSQEEKDLIISITNSCREDNIWKKAILLTGSFIPKEVVVDIFGENILEYDTNSIIQEFINKDLLEPCLNIYTGFPQPLWWNGYHHKNRKFWDKIIHAILEGGEVNQTFKLALKEYMDCLYNYSSRFDEDLELYDALLKSESKVKLVFEKLLLVSATQNQSNKKLWDRFTQKLFFKEDPFYTDLILENIEALQYQQLSDRDLMEYFDWDYILNNIILNIESDNHLLKIINLLKKGHFVLKMNDGTEIRTLDWLKIKLNYEPPKLSLVNKIIKHELESLELIDEELEVIFEDNRRSYITKGSNNSRVFKEQYKLKNWIE